MGFLAVFVGVITRMSVGSVIAITFAMAAPDLAPIGASSFSEISSTFMLIWVGLELISGIPAGYITVALGGRRDLKHICVLCIVFAMMGSFTVIMMLGEVALPLIFLRFMAAPIGSVLGGKWRLARSSSKAEDSFFAEPLSY